MKLTTLLVLILLQVACETPSVDQYNRRDLYSAEPDPASPEAARQMRSQPAPTPVTKPQFR